MKTLNDLTIKEVEDLNEKNKITFDINNGEITNANVENENKRKNINNYK